ncbi:hypothetical protein COCNU_06G017900 [Cocos nucifera]|uniref:Uncharacterized protein n=1 Tax=Cocos nucifera TaxID=13894 RepID=A0A8K0N3S2_COCNU|nr:hypothetical protein COCNU_06G017900 [Cocos nucifera]
MQLQSVCCSHPIPHSSTTLSLGNFWWKNVGFRPGNASKGANKVFYFLPDLENSHGVKKVVLSTPNPNARPMADTSNSGVVRRSGSVGRIGLDPFRGKSGSVSFCGLTHQLLEERKLVSSPFKDGTGSYVWAVGPLALILSLVLPQFFLGNAIEILLKDEILAEIVTSLSSEVIFYAGLAAFLSITNHVQRPYLDFSSKRWSLITGLRGYLSSAFFTMGFKVFVPILAVYVAWPVIGLPAVVSVAPFLLGCAAQFAFEMHLEKHGSSCWPILPIIFEVYRLFQLNKGAHFIETLMFSMRGSSVTPALMERGGTLVSMLVVLQVLGVVCLWSLTTFLLRLFPSRPVAENY